MSHRNRLFSMKNPYDVSATEDLFLQAIRDNCVYEYEHCEAYRKILDEMGFHPQQLKTYADIAEIPFLPTLLFKHHRMYAVPQRKMDRLKALNPHAQNPLINNA